MTFNVRTARRICTAPEVALYAQSRRPGLIALTQKQLNHSINRARRMAERLARKAALPHTGNGDTDTKAALLREVWRRLERYHVEMMSAFEGRNHSSGHWEPPADRATEHSRLGPPAEQAIAQARLDEFALSGSKRVDGMISSRGRQKQNRSDRH